VALVSVAPEATVADVFDAVPLVDDASSLGNVTAPVPTWPPLNIPDVGTLVAAPGALVCAAAGSAASNSIATSAETALMPVPFARGDAARTRQFPNPIGRDHKALIESQIPPPNRCSRDGDNSR
jgi:hypothetical protein